MAGCAALALTDHAADAIVSKWIISAAGSTCLKGKECASSQHVHCRGGLIRRVQDPAQAQTEKESDLARQVGQPGTKRFAARDEGRPLWPERVPDLSLFHH